MSEAKMIACHDVIAQLWAYLDGELTPERTEEIRAHLEMCERCFPQYDFERAFLAFLQKQAWTPAPARLRRRIFEALLEEGAA